LITIIDVMCNTRGSEIDADSYYMYSMLCALLYNLAFYGTIFLPWISYGAIKPWISFML